MNDLPVGGFDGSGGSSTEVGFCVNLARYAAAAASPDAFAEEAPERDDPPLEDDDQPRAASAKHATATTKDTALRRRNI